jgi:hypothetical protein
MALFGKKGKTVDLTSKYDRHVEKMENIRGLVNKAENVNRGENTAPHAQHIPPQVQAAQSNVSPGSFGFLRDMASSVPDPQYPVPTYSEGEESPEDRRRKLAKRLGDITEKLEDLSTQIYHLQQRVELLERKTKSSGFE